MKLVQAVPWYFPTSLGGLEVYVEGLSGRLADAGHDVAVAAPEEGADAPRTYVHAGVRVFRYPVPAEADLTRDERWYRAPVRGTEHLHRWLAAERPDVYHQHGFSPALGVAEARAARALGAVVVGTNQLGTLGYLCYRGTLMYRGERLCGEVARPSVCAPCVLERHGLPRPAALAAGRLPPAASEALSALPGPAGSVFGAASRIRRYLALHRELMETVDRYVLVNQWAIEMLVRNGAPRAKLVLNRLGLSQRGATPKPGPDAAPTTRPVRVGFLGRMVENKGVLDLARAFAALDREAPLVLDLYTAANTPESAGVAERFRALVGDDPRVRLHAPVAPADVPALLAGFDVLCVPSRWFENGPTVLSEAHAVGTPLLGTRIGGMAEEVPHGTGGWLVEPGDGEGLRDALAAVAADPAGTVDRWRRGLPRARTMDEIAADYLALYDGLLDARARSAA